MGSLNPNVSVWPPRAASDQSESGLRGGPRPLCGDGGSETRKLSHGAEMAAEPTGETPALAAENHAPSAGTSESNGEDKEKGLTEAEPAEPGAHVEPKMEEADGEAREEKPAEAADKAPSEAEAHEGTVTVNQEETAAPEEPEAKPEPEQSPGEGNSEPATDSAMKEEKEEPGEDSRCSEADCEKSKAGCEDGEKPSSGGGELDDKRRPSVEISSSDGEPLSRMDSEDRWVWAVTGPVNQGWGVGSEQGPVAPGVGVSFSSESRSVRAQEDYSLECMVLISKHLNWFHTMSLQTKTLTPHLISI